MNIPDFIEKIKQQDEFKELENYVNEGKYLKSFELEESKNIFKDFFKRNVSKNGCITNSSNPSMLFDLFLNDSEIKEDENIKEIMNSGKKTNLFFGPSLIFFIFFLFFLIFLKIIIFLKLFYKIIIKLFYLVVVVKRI
jgi:hypothetical protein